MPQSKEVHREYMRAKRKGSQEGSQKEGSQQGSQLLSRPNGEDYDPLELLYDHPFYKDGTKRYLGPLNDGQVLDRLTV